MMLTMSMCINEKQCGCCQQIKSIDNFYVYKQNASSPGRTDSYCKKCQSILMRERTRVYKRKCLDYKGGKCERCGYGGCDGALEFHHKNPSEKDFHLSEVKNRSFNDKIKTELDKCLLLCANCHREEHYKLLIEQEKNSIEHQMFLKLGNQIEKPEVKPYLFFTCPICDKDFKSKNPNAKYCSAPCSNNSDSRKPKRKVEWPTKEELKHLIETQTWVSIGRMYGVSDNAVRKWAKKYEIPTKRQKDRKKS